MPRVKRKARERIGYTTLHFQELLFGFSYFGPSFNYSRLEADAEFCIGRGGTPEQADEARAQFEAVRDEMRELWRDSRDWLLGE